MEITKQQIIHTDVLIIGGGTAGCYAALTIREKSDAKIVIAEKANIKRSGCLAAGVNAINAYIVKGRKPQDYVDYARKDADEIVRGDLLLTMSEHLNEVTSKMEQLGLVILKDENGDYVARGNRNIKINGENIKPILADAVNQLDNVEVINHLNITDYIVEDNTIKGAFGFHMENGTAYEIRAKKVLCATGGAAGLYKPNNPGFSRHKMWYPPFNTGAGYAMGIDAGAGIMKTTDKAISTYGLDGYTLMTSSSSTMLASLKKAMDKGEWIVITGWTPHWMFDQFDLKFLDDPKKVYGDLEEIHAIASKGFSEKDPFAAEFFGNIKLTTEELSSFMTAMKDARMDEEEIARKWRDEHRQLVDSWIPKSDNCQTKKKQLSDE